MEMVASPPRFYKSSARKVECPMRQTALSLLLSLFVVAALSSCSAYRDDRTSFRWRSEHFQKVLGDSGAVAAFQAGRTAEVAAFIEKQRPSNPAFEKAYQEVLETEGIKFFTARQTADYFYTAIHLKIQK